MLRPRGWQSAMSGAMAWSSSNGWKRTAQLSKDQHHKSSEQVQELTDAEIKQINEMLAAKEAEIMTI